MEPFSYPTPFLAATFWIGKPISKSANVANWPSATTELHAAAAAASILAAISDRAFPTTTTTAADAFKSMAAATAAGNPTTMLYHRLNLWTAASLSNVAGRPL